MYANRYINTFMYTCTSIKMKIIMQMDLRMNMYMINMKMKINRLTV
jgi:hypothetical protein